MTLGERIERRRKEIGISQAELARQVGVSQSTMNSLINGNSKTTRSLVKIARLLKTTPAYLSGEIDDPSLDAAAVGISERDQEWLDLLHSLSPRDQNAVYVLTRTLAESQHQKGPKVMAFQGSDLSLPMAGRAIEVEFTMGNETLRGTVRPREKPLRSA